MNESGGDISRLMEMAEAVRLQKEFTSAETYYRQVLELDPEHILALRGLGDALRGLHQFETAIEIWKKIFDLKGDEDVFLLTRIADCYKALEKCEDAQQYYMKTLSLKKHNRYALIGLADLYHKHGEDALAIEYYEKALASGVTLIKILTIVGSLYYRLRNYEKARFYYEKTLEQEPDNTYALYGLGNYYRWKSDYRRAVQMWEKVTVKHAGSVNMIARLGDAYRNIGQFEDAERAYKSNLDERYHKFSLSGLIKLYALQGRITEVCAWYDELLRNEHAEEKSVLSEVGELLIKRKKVGLARQFLLHVQARQSKSPAVCRIIEEKLRLLENS
ncbi:MAG TPA: tetratricopeptide repeat protein [Desulfuromonadales bacterium]|nr:tetratricopeptide repeat protein [Desulfuromonadales bacterium]